MAQARRQDMKELTDLVRYATRGLSQDAVATLVAHPDAVKSALAVAADALSDETRDLSNTEVIEGPRPRLVDPSEAQWRIEARSRAGQKEDFLTSDELADSVGLKTRQSVHDWRKKGKIVGWQQGKRGYVFPAGQFDERGQPTKGLDQVVSCFQDSYAAWIWLTTPSAALDGVTPLSCLRQGQADLVVAAAQGDLQGDFA